MYKKSIEFPTFRGEYERILRIVPFPAFTIFDHPLDFPDHFVVRIFSLEDGKVLPLPFCVLKESLEACREAIPEGLVPLDRMEEDDEKIVETWI